MADPASDVQKTGYDLQTTPHKGVGAFRMEHDPDRPVLAYYGGIGLQLDENGEWTDYGIASKDAVEYLIKRCADHGMKRICANIMFQWTPSRLLGPIPIKPVPDDAESLYGYAIEQAHKHNIEVYIDIPVFGRRTRDTAFAEANPDIYTKSLTGEVREEFFSPAHPKVRAYRIAILLEALSMYPADGILLDFIRWPSYDLDLLNAHSDWGYEDVMLERFRTAYGLPDDYVPEPDDPRFIQARADCVTQFIRELRQALADNGIELPIGVYNSNIYGREAGMRHVCQDWAAWEEQGLVDQHHPMFYMDSPARLTYALATLVEIKRPGSTVFGPIFLDGPGDFTQPRLVDAARRMVKVGADGIWFCREMEIEALGLWPAVKQISELSISGVHAQEFDPYEENLVVNGTFDAGVDGWEVSPQGVASVHGLPSSSDVTFLRIGAELLATTEVSQTIRHHGGPVVGLRSLGVSLRYRIESPEADRPPAPQVVLELLYTNGDVESHTLEPGNDNTADSGWQNFDASVMVGYSDGRWLESTTVRIRCPRGSGVIDIDDVAITPDVLHYPMNHKPKDESQ
jgi:hypothetical protein